MSQITRQPCPDFDLAPLISMPPSVIGQEPIHGFVLSMALAFNDLKGMMWTLYQLEKCRPDTSQLSGEVGQWTGMRVHLSRLCVGLLREVLLAIHAAEQKGVLNHQAIVNGVASLPAGIRADWDELRAVAGGGASGLSGYLEQVRHNAAFHYYQPKALLKGYQHHFFSGPSTQNSEFAYYSIGTKMEASRFYFADAAAQAYVARELDPSGDLFAQTREHIQRLGQVLVALVARWLIELKEAETA